MGFILERWKKIRVVSHMEFDVNLLLILQRDLFVMCLERVLGVPGKREENMVLQCGSGLGRARSNCFTCRQDTSVLLCNVT